MIQILNLNRIVHNEPLGIKEFILIDSQETTFSLNNEIVTLEAPKGFIWDGATIPRLFWSIIGYYPAGIMLPPSLWHDLIYINKGILFNKETNTDIFISRKDCDLLFKEHCVIMGVNPKAANKMYNIIRKFGWIYWIDNKITRIFRTK